MCSVDLGHLDVFPNVWKPGSFPGCEENLAERTKCGMLLFVSLLHRRYSVSFATTFSMAHHMDNWSLLDDKLESISRGFCSSARGNTRVLYSYARHRSSYIRRSEG